MNCDPAETAVVFIDPQNDVLSPTGKNWGAVGASVTENKTSMSVLGRGVAPPLIFDNYRSPPRV
jgi:nicotinamidase-related amidase